MNHNYPTQDDVTVYLNLLEAPISGEQLMEAVSLIARGVREMYFAKKHHLEVDTFVQSTAKFLATVSSGEAKRIKRTIESKHLELYVQEEEEKERLWAIEQQQKLQQRELKAEIEQREKTMAEANEQFGSMFVNMIATWLNDDPQYDVLDYEMPEWLMLKCILTDQKHEIMIDLTQEAMMKLGFEQISKHLFRRTSLTTPAYLAAEPFDYGSGATYRDGRLLTDADETDEDRQYAEAFKAELKACLDDELNRLNGLSGSRWGI